jgi:3-isopropylmalate/(R)-2-methylmalate dehydratase small subunit
MIHNRTSGKSYQAKPLPEFVLKIAEAGGLVKFLREHDLEELAG